MAHLPPSSFPRIAVVGAGYWGKNLIRSFHQLGALHTICDSRAEVLSTFKTQYPGVAIQPSFEALLLQKDIDAVVLATPSLTHYPLGMQVLEAGKHLYVEKPLATTLTDAKALVALAEGCNRTLMVGHLLMYHPAINRIKQIMDAGQLGQVRYIQSDRLNYNHGRNDRNALWDLAPHDLSVLLYLLQGQRPEVRVATATNTTHRDDKHDVIQASLAFPNGVMGHLQTSWVYPRKQVQLMVIGTEASLVLDDTLPLDKRLMQVRHDGDGQRHETPMEYLPMEPLRLECQHFINALKGEWRPQSDERNGLAVVELLEHIQHAIDANPDALKG